MGNSPEREPIIILAESYQQGQYFVRSILNKTMKDVTVVTDRFSAQRLNGMKLKRDQVHYYTHPKDFFEIEQILEIRYID